MMLMTSRLFGLWLILVAEAIHYDDHATNLFDNNTSSRDRRYILQHYYMWPKALVPFSFEESAARSKASIMRIIDYVEEQSCVRFLPWNKELYKQHGLSHQSRVSFYQGDGCHSNQGFLKIRDVAKTSCCTDDACLHEVGHALGLVHEQTSTARLGWIDVLEENIPEKLKWYYELTYKPIYEDVEQYDVSTVMHYAQLAYYKDRPVFAKDFPELPIGGQDFYYFKQLAEGYRCHEMPQCQGRDLGCEEDGYQTIQQGECRCVCPRGLDPDDRCRSPLKKVLTTSWPKGHYSFLKPKTGCPTGGDFDEGQVLEFGQGGNSMSTNTLIAGNVKDTLLELEFCTRKVKDGEKEEEETKFNWPLGNFCIFRRGGKCPTGFDPIAVNYTVNLHATRGEAPDYDSGRMKLCCQYRGFTRQPAWFPVDKPFTLIRHPFGTTCQEVRGMRHSPDSFTIASPDFIQFEGDLQAWRSGNRAVNIPLCQYTPLNMECYDVRTVSADHRLVTIEVSGGQDNEDRGCTWIIKGVDDKGTLVLDFEKFDVGPSDRTTECEDRVEVRHGLLGQQGLEYCGKVEHSIRSITHEMILKFFTVGHSNSSFKANVRWVPFTDMCYDVDSRGTRYDGNVNYTRMFEPCLPWAEMDQCTHNPFNGQDDAERVQQLTGNACRNPDNSFRPWCYTDKVGCKRNYCDVCGLEKPYDHMEHCDKLKKTGFCTRDAANAIKYCAATCFDQLPTKPQTKKYTEVTCSKPIPPPDGLLVSSAKSSYALGETVLIRCRTMNNDVSTRCMTSGHWSRTLPVCTICPNGYELLGDQCIGATPKHPVVTFKAAKRACVYKGGELAAPRNQMENEIIRKVVGFSDVWIGITDARTEGTWLYARGGKTLTWTNWEQGEPNNYGDEDCAIIRGFSDYWLDMDCDSRSYRFACSIPAWEVDKCRDPAGEDMCQSLLIARPTLCKDLPQFAESRCPKSCGFCQDRKIMCPVSQGPHPNVRPVTTPNNFPAVSIGQTIQYSCQDFKYPVKGDHTRVCLTSGKLSGQPLECDSCPQGYDLVYDECHGLIPGKPMTFKEASQECHKVDGFIAMPKTLAENDIVSQIGLGVSLWIGATDAMREGIFEWQDGSSISWSNWSSGEPKQPKSDDDVDCAFMNEDRKWINIDCEGRKLSTVCTIPKSDDDTCYDMRDGGISYDGPVNFTRTQQPCLPWTEVTHCPHHAFKTEDERANLVGNACRNPDKSYRPWCYTDVAGCKWNYCDVCGNDSPKDARTDCSLFKYKGLCTSDPTKALQDCAAKCWGSLPGRKPAMPYTTIQCGAPTPPRDGTVVGAPKASYRVGESVEYKCKRADWSVFARCMTSGQWSQTGYACPACPEDFVHHGDQCLQAVKQRAVYHSARDHCGHRGGQIAMPDSEDELRYFFTLIGQKAFIWIGLTDEKTEGEWVTEGGQNPKWVNWNPGSPQTDMTKNCAYTYFSLTMNNARCDRQRFQFICSIPTLGADYCDDYLIDECPQLLAQQPKMCEKHPEFAELKCAKTCGICNVDKSTCSYPTVGPNVGYVMSKAINTGDYLEFICTSETYRTEGDEVRACLPDGNWTGKPLQCGDCPAGFKLVSNACLGAVEGRVQAYDEAKDDCRKLGGFVAMPKSVAENDVINELADQYDAWIGASDEASEGNFVWADGQPVNWVNWARATTNNGNTEDNNCLAMNTNALWIHVNCKENAFRTVCSIPLKGKKCKHSFDGKCYNPIGDASSHAMTYDEGVNVCQRMGGRLPAPRNQDEANFIRDVMTKHGVQKYAWLGIDDKRTEGTWTYEDGELLKWKNWAHEQPNDYGDEGEDCAVQDLTTTLWMDMPCDYRYPVICTVDQLISARATCPPPTPKSDNDVMVTPPMNLYFAGDTVVFKCTRNDTFKVYSRCMTNGQWSDSGLACLDCLGSTYNGHCYKAYRIILEYDAAVKVCEDTGYELVAPRSKAETEFLRSLWGGLSFWIGITDRKMETQWRYEDGSHVMWSNWAPDEPNNWSEDGNGGEDCVVMRSMSGEWNDVSCGALHDTVVCVKKLQ